MYTIEKNDLTIESNDNLDVILATMLALVFSEPKNNYKLMYDNSYAILEHSKYVNDYALELFKNTIDRLVKQTGQDKKELIAYHVCNLNVKAYRELYDLDIDVSYCLEQADNLANNHSNFDSFSWHGEPDNDSQIYTIIYGRHRDSDLLSESNWQACLELMGETTDNFWIESHSSWLVGWLECFVIKVYQDSDKHMLTREFIDYCMLIKKPLEDYPLLNDEDYYQREHEQGYDNFLSCFTFEKNKHERKAYKWICENGYESQDGNGAYPSDEQEEHIKLHYIHKHELKAELSFPKQLFKDVWSMLIDNGYDGCMTEEYESAIDDMTLEYNVINAFIKEHGGIEYDDYIILERDKFYLYQYSKGFVYGSSLYYFDDITTAKEYIDSLYSLVE